MITLKDFMECVEYKITEGATYQWDCFGPNAYSLDYWNGKHDDEGVSVTVVFDTVNQTVYEFTAWDYRNNVQYRWIHPGYIEGQAAEALRRGQDFYQSYDDFKFVDIELPEDILEKANAIVRDEEYDERIMVQLDLSYEQEHLLMELAHEADMSLNKFVDHILRLKIRELQGL